VTSAATTRGLAVGGVAALLLSACIHAREATQPPRPAPATARRDAAGIVTSTAPAGLLSPGAEGQIQAALIARGFLPPARRSGRLDDPTRDALLAFQARADLPRTGLPSYGTVERLGLRPRVVFMAAWPDEASRR
jgi:hypothetical protein